MIRIGLFAAVALAGGSLPYITALLPLQQFMNEAEVIVEGVIESADAEKKTCVVKVTKSHKGKSPYTHIRIDIGAAPSDWKRDGAVKHYVAGARAVLFYKNDPYRKATWRGQIYVNRFFCPLIVKKDEPPETAVWKWDGLEIHLNRTYNRPAEELSALVSAVLLGKAKAPAPDPKVPEIGKEDLLALPLPGVKVADEKLPAAFRKGGP